MTQILISLLIAGLAGQPTCSAPENVGVGIPLLCPVTEPIHVETSYFSIVLEPGIRYGLCDDGSCLHARAMPNEPWFSIDVHQGGMKGELEGIDSHQELAEKLAGEKRPCESIGVENRQWVSCQYDYSSHPADGRIMEGDYYRLVGDHWLALSYRVSRGDHFDRDAGRYRRMLFSLRPAETYQRSE
jgi:hypothetical protein